MSEIDAWFAMPSAHAQVRDGLRALLRHAGLEETWKWRQPCYGVDGKNIAILAERRDGCTVSLLKGSLLPETGLTLETPGENSRSARYVRVPSLAALEAMRGALLATLEAAVAVERSGARVAPAPLPEVWVDALAQALAVDDALRAAFEALTPGRQRAYDLLIRGAKQATTREARVQAYRARILDGKGPNDCTCGRTRRPPGCDGTHKHPETPPSL